MPIVAEDLRYGMVSGRNDERREPPWWEHVIFRDGDYTCIPIVEVERTLTMPELLELVKPLLKESIRDYIAEERREILDKIRHAKSFDDVYNALV